MQSVIPYSGNKTIATAAMNNPVNKILPGTTPYTIKEITKVITGISPVVSSPTG
jgi:hypothetical protein